MNRPSTVNETAQSLLKEIGRDQVLDYFTKRLQVGKDLASRSTLVAAFGQLAGPESRVLLSQIASDLMERRQVRVAATKALGNIAKQLSEVGEQSELTRRLIELLGDDLIEVRSAAAIQLVDLQPLDAISFLRELNEKDKLEILAREEVQKFLVTVPLPSAEFLPPLTTHLFVGRHGELQVLNNAFTKSQIVYIVGIGGIGKTTLSAQFANQSNYDVKIWRSCRNSPDLAYLATDILSTLAEMLEPTRKNSRKEQIIAAHFNITEVEAQIVHFLSNRSALLVLDDYEVIKESTGINMFLENLVGRLPQLSCLIVGRIVPKLSKAVVIKLKGLTFEESHKLLREEAHERQIDLGSDDGQKLIQLADGNPLILKFFASQLSLGLPYDKIRSGNDAVSTIMGESLKELSLSELRALEVLSQFDEPISYNDPEINELFVTEQIGPLSPVLQRLVQLSFVELFSQEKIAVIHSLVREFIIRRTDHRTILRINKALGHYYQGRGNILRSATHYIRAELSADAVILISDHTEDIINQGHVSIALGLLDLDIASTKLEMTARIRLFASVGEFSQFLARYDDAIKSYLAALDLGKRLGDYANITQVVNKLGQVYMALGQYSEAHKLFSEGIKIAQREDNITMMSSLLTNLGSIDVRLGKLDQAEAYYQKGLAISNELRDSRQVSLILLNLGSIAEMRGGFSRAETYLKESLDLAKRLDDRQTVVRILTALGNLAAKSDKHVLATNFLQEGLNLARQLQDREYTVYLLSNLGKVALDSGEYALAEKYTFEALSAAREMGHLTLVTSILNQAGTVHFEQNRHSEANKMFLESLHMAEELGYQEMVAENQYGLACVARAEGNLLEARLQAQKSLQIFESLDHYRKSYLKEWIEKLDL